MLIKKVSSDIYEPDPDTVEKCLCGICGEEMDVKRGNPAGRGFASAMAGHNRRYDKFWCKYRKEKWHQQAKAIKNQIYKMPSKKLSDLMQEELDYILETKIPTKEGYYGNY